MAYLLHCDNGLPILTWFDDKNDRELYKIIPILEFLSTVSDVRDYICKMVVNNEISYDNVKSVTPGQACVFYDGEKCLGGGIIKEVRYNNEKLWYLL